MRSRKSNCQLIWMSSISCSISVWLVFEACHKARRNRVRFSAGRRRQPRVIVSDTEGHRSTCGYSNSDIYKPPDIQFYFKFWQITSLFCRLKTAFGVAKCSATSSNVHLYFLSFQVTVVFLVSYVYRLHSNFETFGPFL